MACLTVPTMMSRTPAWRRWLPPRTRMQSSSRAPVLSATLSRDSCWIIGVPGPLQHVDEAPALAPAEGAALDHADCVAHVRLVLLVVSVERRRRADDLLVHAVL